MRKVQTLVQDKSMNDFTDPVRRNSLRDLIFEDLDNCICMYNLKGYQKITNFARLHGVMINLSMQQLIQIVVNQQFESMKHLMSANLDVVRPYSNQPSKIRLLKTAIMVMKSENLRDNECFTSPLLASDFLDIALMSELPE